jgi:hypothetical protein
MSELSVGSLSGLAANSYVIDVASGSSLDLSNGATLPAGSIIAVKDAIFTGTQTASVTAGDNVAVTDLSITHEVADASNKLIISAFIGVAGNTRGRNETGIAIHDGTNLIGVGDASSSRTQVSAGGVQKIDDSIFTVTNMAISFVHTPGAGSKTYTVRAVNISSATQTHYINRSEEDSDSAVSSRGASSLIIQEVAV